MPNATAVLVLLFAVAGIGALSRRLPIPVPLLLVAGGIGLSFVPAMGGVHLDPAFFFLVFIPPLLYADGWLIPKREFFAAMRPVLALALGLVAATVVAAGYLVHWLLPEIPLAAAFALGAVISPTDAVAVSAVTEKLRLPARVSHIVAGESLINDATGLVAFKFAVAAVTTGLFSWSGLALDFAWLSVGGIAIGLAMAWAIGALRVWLTCGRLSEPTIQAILSLSTPYVAYVAAEAAHTSGILAAVAAGLYSGIHDTRHLTPDTRRHTWEVWSLLLYVLNGLVFLLLGLEFRALFSVVSGSEVGRVAAVALALCVTLTLVRLAWVYPGAYLPHWVSDRVRRREPRPKPREVFIVGWSGIRGTVTLAAALSIPLTTASGAPFPGRDVIIVLACSVILFTLIFHALTLPPLIRWLDIRADNREAQEERAARLALAQAALTALGTRRSHLDAAADRALADRLAVEYRHEIEALSANAARREQLAEDRAHERALRRQAIAAERAELHQLRDQKAINETVLRRVMADIDRREALLEDLGDGHGH